MFDADALLSQETTESMDTEFVQVPNGEYLASIDDIKMRQQDSKDPGQDPYTIMDVYWAIDDPAVSEVTGREKNVVRQSVFLDISASGGLDGGKGKNVDLGRLREAVNQNTGAWAPAMLLGQVATIRTEQAIFNGKTYVNVKGVAKAA